MCTQCQLHWPPETRGGGGGGARPESERLPCHGMWQSRCVGAASDGRRSAPQRPPSSPRAADRDHTSRPGRPEIRLPATLSVPGSTRPDQPDQAAHRLGLGRRPTGRAVRVDTKPMAGLVSPAAGGRPAGQTQTQSRQRREAPRPLSPATASFRRLLRRPDSSGGPCQTQTQSRQRRAAALSPGPCTPAAASAASVPEAPPRTSNARRRRSPRRHAGRGASQGLARGICGGGVRPCDAPCAVVNCQMRQREGPCERAERTV